MARTTPFISRSTAFHSALVLTFMAGGCTSPAGHGGGVVAPAPAVELLPDPSWHLYDSSGAALELPALAAHLLSSPDSPEVVFVGERHGDAGTHAFQRDLLEALLAERDRQVEAGREPRPIVLSLEMFEWDVQELLNEYLGGYITEDHFLAGARPWPNYARDYRPTVELAGANDLPVVAANAPRRYVNRVSRLGRDALAELPEAAFRWLPPLPYPEPSDAYRSDWDALMSGAGGHGMGESALQAQALWDAGMGMAVARALSAHPGALVLHLAGGFHVENGTGTPEALLHYRPGTRFLVVAARPVEDPEVGPPPGLVGLGDYLVLTGR